jgi:hypothetical protein
MPSRFKSRTLIFHEAEEQFIDHSPALNKYNAGEFVDYLLKQAILIGLPECLLVNCRL